MAFTQQQQHPSYPCFQGASGLQYVCENSDYLVVLLPLNAETSHIINKDTLKCCQPNCVLINVGRGHHINETDLINALDNYQLKKAVLDVFQQEPLPVDHPFWSHPKITITPHSSSRSDVTQTAQAIVNHYCSMS